LFVRLCKSHCFLDHRICATQGFQLLRPPAAGLWSFAREVQDVSERNFAARSSYRRPEGQVMRFSVCHETHYRYSAPVALAAHLLRLTPRADRAILRMHRLTIDPLPSVRQDLMDRYGNPLTQLEFEGSSRHLRIESLFDLETHPSPAPSCLALPPLPWPSGRSGAMADYLPPQDQDESVRAFAAGLACESGWEVPSFLECLNQTLFTRTIRHIRPEGAAQAPAHTLAAGKGACRDLTVLFMAACRCLGIAARFVSGYQAHAESFDGHRHLHAWAEVFLPGSGWHGFDPMHGLPVTDGHVALCAAPDQAATMPVEGGYYGDGVTSTLDYKVRITARP
jgi:transglutaminase-like putative cysteine protease